MSDDWEGWEDDSYDPSDFADDPDCDHGDYEVDILTGWATCCTCHEHWPVSDEELNNEVRRQATYYEDMERENRRQWWRDLFEPIVSLFRLCRWCRRHPVEIDDEVPF